jgi:hypothetical protein
VPHVPRALDLAVEVLMLTWILNEATNNIVLEVSVGVFHLQH